MRCRHHKSVDFNIKYGVLIKEHRILRRAIFITSQKDIIVYSAYMQAIGEEPNYPEVLEAAKRGLSD